MEERTELRTAPATGREQLLRLGREEPEENRGPLRHLGRRKPEARKLLLAAAT